MGTAPIPMPSSSSALHCGHKTFYMIHTGPCLEACFPVPPFCCDASAFVSHNQIFTLFAYTSHRCLEFEQKLLDVMELRKAAKNIKETKSPANAGCIRRCHETFEAGLQEVQGRSVPLDGLAAVLQGHAEQPPDVKGELAICAVIMTSTKKH